MNEIRHLHSAQTKQWPKQVIELKPTDNKIRVIKAKAEIILENESYDIVSYITWIESHFSAWILSLTKEERVWFRQCLKFIWNLMIEIENDKKFFLKIVRKDKEKLTEIERFYFAFILYLFKTDEVLDELNNDNFKYIIDRLIIESPENQLYKYLARYIKRILEATEILLGDSPDMFDYNYLLNPINELLPKDDEEYRDDEWDDEPIPPNAV